MERNIEKIIKKAHLVKVLKDRANECTRRITEWANSYKLLEGQAFRAFEASSNAMEQAAEQSLLLDTVTYVEDESFPVESTREDIINVIDQITQYLDPLPRSTSATSNIMEAMKLHVARNIKRYDIGSILSKAQWLDDEYQAHCDAKAKEAKAKREAQALVLQGKKARLASLRSKASRFDRGKSSTNLSKVEAEELLALEAELKKN